MIRHPHPVNRPARSRVAAAVRDLIAARRLHVGDRLPSYTALIRDLGISLVTVKRGLDDLEREGVIFRRPARGIFVAREIARAPRALEHVGVIFAASRASFFQSPYVGEIMRGLTQAAPAPGGTHIFSVREDGLIRAEQLGEWRIDGAVLLGLENDEYLRSFASWGTPGVVVDYCSQAAPLDYVACDNAAAVRRMVAHLSALGHGRVAYVCSHPEQAVCSPRNARKVLFVRDSSDTRERRAESLRLLGRRGMLCGQWEVPAGGMSPGWLAAVGEALGRSSGKTARPTAILTDSESLALRLIAELERRGLRVPADISVCALASAGGRAPGDGHLTCCRFDFEGMGRTAVKLLARRCSHPRPLAAPRVHRIGFAFVAGHTTRPVAGGPARRRR